MYVWIGGETARITVAKATICSTTKHTVKQLGFLVAIWSCSIFYSLSNSVIQQTLEFFFFGIYVEVNFNFGQLWNRSWHFSSKNTEDIVRFHVQE